jgi:hypothetical protein
MTVSGPSCPPSHPVLRFEEGVVLRIAPVLLGVREAGRERTSVGPVLFRTRRSV